MINKTFLSISLVCMSLLPGFIHAKESINDKIISAIEKSDRVMVKRLLSRMGNELTRKDKKEFLESAIDTIDDRIENVSFKKSYLDLAKFFVGVPLSAVGTLLLGVVVKTGMSKNSSDKEYLVVGIGASALMLIPGLYLTVKGWQCSTASARVTAAEQVEELIKESVPTDTL
ncbi:hypothetical protein H0W26_04460 [Candidatus Dependentiae bacterium]|nr:hypothetical protein [Candidatus Dependentiae bacterium]